MPASILKLAVALVLALAVARSTGAAPTPAPDAETGNAYSGAGGHAAGGSVSSSPGSATGSGPLGGLEILEVFSHNGGAGGKANSGAAMAMMNSTSSGDDKMGNAYSGVGGNANGGSVKGGASSLLSLFSENGGKGGDASSGPAVAGAPVVDSSKSKVHIPTRMLRMRRRLTVADEVDMD